LLKALAEEPHASVLQAMIVASDRPGAAEILGADVLKALGHPSIRELLRDRVS
jgi:hypothetical protein